jgi:hypothetical protein
MVSAMTPVYALVLRYGDDPPPEHWRPYEDPGGPFLANAVRGQVFHRTPHCTRVRIKRDLAALPLEDAARRESPVTREVLAACPRCYPSEKGRFAALARSDPDKIIRMVKAYEDGDSSAWELGTARPTRPRTV